MFVTTSVRASIALVISLLASGILTSSLSALTERDGDFLDLKAASRSSDLLRRDTEIRIVQSAELSYVDSENHDTEHSIFYSRVNFTSKSPFVILEDMEHHLEDVTCNASNIELLFHSRNTFDAALDIFTSLIGGYIITSHMGCNVDGARAPFLIESVSASYNLIITLSAVEVSWKQAFQSFKISYGHCTERHRVRHHSTSLLRRQDAGSTVPTDTPTDTIVDLDLGFQALDSDFGLGAINLGCKNCTTTGQLKLTQGTFDLIDIDEVDISDLPNVFDIITEGSVQLDMSFGAHIELKASPSLVGVMTHILYTKPLRGFNIKGFGKAGLLFEPTLHFEWVLQGGIEMSYGFELQIPDNSQIFLNVANPNESTVTGFEQTTLAPVPFQANTSDITMSMRIALRPRIAVGFGFFDNRILAEFGAHIELPNTNITITQLASSASNPIDCSPLTQSQTTSLLTEDLEFNKLYSNLTHVTSSVGLAVGFDVLAEIKVDNFPDPRADFSFEIWEKFVEGPSACLVFQDGQDEGEKFQEAAVVKNKKKNAGGRLVGGYGVFGLVVYCLVVVGAGFGFM